MFALLPYDFVKYKDGKRFERSLCSESKGDDQLHCICFSICKKEGFLMTRLILQLSSEYSFN